MYATREDLERRIGSADRLAVLLSDEQGIEVPGRLDGAIADAEAEIDSALAAFYPMPLSPGTAIPGTVVRWTADLALEHLAADRPFSGSGPIARRADRARTEIAETASGRRMVPGLTRRDPTAGAGDVPTAPRVW